jgi:excisionase family DNA binding protein
MSPETAQAQKTKPEAVQAALLTVDDVATLCGVSTRHILRLSDAGKMPRPLKLGRLSRWRRDEIDRWIGSGCSKHWQVKS